jgi:hypothetical protein
MADLTAQDFSAGQQHFVAIDGVGELVLRVDLVEALPLSTRPGGGFRFELVGPPEPVLPLAIYPLRHEGIVREIFVVPVAREEAGIRYEAIFN